MVATKKRQRRTSSRGTAVKKKRESAVREKTVGEDRREGDSNGDGDRGCSTTVAEDKCGTPQSNSTPSQTSDTTSGTSDVGDEEERIEDSQARDVDLASLERSVGGGGKSGEGGSGEATIGEGETDSENCVVVGDKTRIGTGTTISCNRSSSSVSSFGDDKYDDFFCSVRESELSNLAVKMFQKVKYVNDKLLDPEHRSGFLKAFQDVSKMNTEAKRTKYKAVLVKSIRRKFNALRDYFVQNVRDAVLQMRKWLGYIASFCVQAEH